MDHVDGRKVSVGLRPEKSLFGNFCTGIRKNALRAKYAPKTIIHTVRVIKNVRYISEEGFNANKSRVALFYYVYARIFSRTVRRVNYDCESH